MAKIVTIPCRLGLLPAAQNFLATIWPLIEILRSLVTQLFNMKDNAALTAYISIVASKNTSLKGPRPIGRYYTIMVDMKLAEFGLSRASRKTE